MATRLYPQTDDRALLEILAGVPAGTGAALERFEAERDLVERQAAERQRPIGQLERWSGKAVRTNAPQLDDVQLETYRLRRQQPALERLYDFQRRGWGRLRDWRAVEEAGLDPVCGQTDEPHLMLELIFGQHVELLPGARGTLALLQEHKVGLCWG